MTNKAKTFLEFDFQTIDGAVQAPLLFSDPKKIITTTTFQHVQSCLHEVDQAVTAGNYVAGYVSYELIYALEKTPSPHVSNNLPILWFGVFDQPSENQREKQLNDFHIGEWNMQQSWETYETHFHLIKQAIQKESIAELNYTVSFQAPFTGDSYPYYEQLKKAQSARFNAYLSIENMDILSVSPELFFQSDHDTITIRPMKGTIHRGKSSEEDLQLKKWLADSEKNKSENRLTVEWMQAELQKVAVPDSIEMIDQYKIEKYPTVYQMTTGLTGKLKENLTVTAILKSLFPCGSIAGVPKRHSYELIRTLERRPREVYCGAIGYITPEKQAIFNVPIRTVWIDRQKQTAHYGAGGAITKDSDVKEEYLEVLTKTNVLTWKRPSFKLLETFGLYDGDYIVFDEHLHRLKQSAAYFDMTIDLEKIQEALLSARAEHPSGNWRVRLTVKNENLKITCVPLPETEPQHIRLAEQPIDKENLFLYHKTTYRDVYDAHKVNADDVFDVLLWNEAGEITECTTGNIVVELNGHYCTPPVLSGLLPGTFRAHLLKNGILKERVILKKELEQCKKIWFINSVRKWVKVTLIQ